MVANVGGCEKTHVVLFFGVVWNTLLYTCDILFCAYLGLLHLEVLLCVVLNCFDGGGGGGGSIRCGVDVNDN